MGACRAMVSAVCLTCSAKAASSTTSFASLDVAHHSVLLPLVSDRLLWGFKCPELADVRSRGEMAAVPAKHHHPHRVVAIDLLAQRLNALVHGECEGVPRLWTVHRHIDHAVLDFVLDLVLGRAHAGYTKASEPRWRNRYTRTFEGRVPVTA